jgi:scyllo-inositol 2-dehydrogenase (NADP+)
MATPRKTNTTTTERKGPIRVGLVGLGRAGWSMQCDEIDRYPTKFKLVAGCDTLKVRRDNFVERYNQPAYANIRQLIADENVEMVSIATRSCDHFKHAKLALEAGKDVFLEKPMTTNYDDARKLLALSKKVSGKLYIRQNRRFEDGFMHIRKILDSGILGEIHEIKLRRHTFNFRGDWQTLKRYGGGQLLNWGPHIIDHALQFLGGTFKSVAADLRIISAVGDAEDHVKLLISGASGPTVDLEISGGAAIGETTYQIFGSRGALRSGDDFIQLKYLDPKAKLEIVEADPGTPGSEGHPPMPNHVLVKHGKAKRDNDIKWIEKEFPIDPAPTDIWKELYASVRKGKEFPVKLEGIVEAMRLVDAARKASTFYRTR